MSREKLLFTIVYEYDDARVENRGTNRIAIADLGDSLSIYGFSPFEFKSKHTNDYETSRFYLSTEALHSPNVANDIIAQSAGVLALWLCEGGIDDSKLFSAHIWSPPVVSESMTIEARELERQVQQNFKLMDATEFLDGFGL